MRIHSNERNNYDFIINECASRNCNVSNQLIVFERFPSYTKTEYPKEERRCNSEDRSRKRRDVFRDSLTDSIQPNNNCNRNEEKVKHNRIWERENLVHVIREVLNHSVRCFWESIRVWKESKHQDANRCENNTPESFISYSLERVQHIHFEEFFFHYHLSGISKERSECK